MTNNNLNRDLVCGREIVSVLLITVTVGSSNKIFYMGGEYSCIVMLIILTDNLTTVFHVSMLIIKRLA